MDATQASTSAQTGSTDTPAILISQETTDDASLAKDSPPAPASSSKLRLRTTAHGGGPYFFTPLEENSLALSGVGVFSPAASQPGSPVLERRSLSALSLETGSVRRRKNTTRMNVANTSALFSEHNEEDAGEDESDLIVRRRTTTR